MFSGMKTFSEVSTSYEAWTVQHQVSLLGLIDLCAISGNKCPASDHLGVQDHSCNTHIVAAVIHIVLVITKGTVSVLRLYLHRED